MLFSRNAVLSALLLASRVTLSQTAAPGYIITAGQDSLRGAIVVHDEQAQQKKVDFITAQGNQRQLLDANSLRAYGYTTDRDTVRYVSVRMNLGRMAGKPEALFLRQLVGGRTELYQYHYLRNYYIQPSRMVVAPFPKAVNISHPPLASPRVLSYPLDGLVFPPLNATDARGGTGVALLLRRDGQPGFIIATQWSFPKDAATYFADCPALASDLQAKHYKERNLPQLVRRYNTCQTGQH